MLNDQKSDVRASLHARFISRKRKGAENCIQSESESSSSRASLHARFISKKGGKNGAIDDATKKSAEEGAVDDATKRGVEEGVVNDTTKKGAAEGDFNDTTKKGAEEGVVNDTPKKNDAPVVATPVVATPPVVATSVTDIDTQNINPELLTQVARMEVVLEVQMKDTFTEVGEPVVQAKDDNSNADADTNETPRLSGRYSDNDSIGPPPPPPLMVPTRTKLDAVDGKAATEPSAKRFRRNTRSSSNSIPEGKLNSEMIEKIAAQVSRE